MFKLDWKVDWNNFIIHESKHGLFMSRRAYNPLPVFLIEQETLGL